jgi:hypothetical protein
MWYIDFCYGQHATLSTDTLNGSNAIAGDLQNYLCASGMVRKNREAARWRSGRCPVVSSSSFQSTGRARLAIGGMAAAAAGKRKQWALEALKEIGMK